MGKFAWKNARVVLLPDRRSDAERGRVRTRPVCADCAKEGAKSQAQRATWCEGLCKKHARKHGLTHPPKKACEPSATGKKTKLMQDRFGDKLKWAKEEEPEEKEHKEGRCLAGYLLMVRCSAPTFERGRRCRLCNSLRSLEHPWQRKNGDGADV